MGQFEEAAKRALEMTQVDSFLKEYLASKGLVWPSDGNSQTAKLNEAAKLCVNALRGRIEDAIRQYRENGSQGTAGARKDDYFLSWLSTTGETQIDFLRQAARAGSKEELYRKARICELLENAIDGAEDEGPDTYCMWIIEAVGQFYGEFATKSVGYETAAKRSVWQQAEPGTSWELAKAQAVTAEKQMVFTAENDSQDAVNNPLAWAA